MTLTVATGIAGIVAALSPLLLRYVHLDGLQMAAFSYLVSLGIAVAAGLITGDLQPNTNSLLLILGGSATFWSVQQAVFKILNASAPAMVRPLRAPAVSRTGQLER